jgi:hypothetical protein
MLSCQIRVLSLELVYLCIVERAWVEARPHSPFCSRDHRTINLSWGGEPVLWICLLLHHKLIFLLFTRSSTLGKRFSHRYIDKCFYVAANRRTQGAPDTLRHPVNAGRIGKCGQLSHSASSAVTRQNSAVSCQEPARRDQSLLMALPNGAQELPVSGFQGRPLRTTKPTEVSCSNAGLTATFS